MTDDTKNCDEVAEYIETSFKELKGAVSDHSTQIKVVKFLESVSGASRRIGFA